MQNSDESTIKAMKAIAALAQVKAIAEELQVDESVALRIVEDACGGARVFKDYLRNLEDACGGAGAAGAGTVGDWVLSASEAQGTSRKCGEGACKAKEEAQAPAPVSKPAAPEAAPEATDEIWDTDLDKIWVGSIKIGSQNRVTIPLRIIEQAERINGVLKSKRHNFGALTVIKGDGKVTVLFGDKSAEHEGVSVVHLNCKGQAQFCASPAFTDGDTVNCSLFKDGTITLTLIDEDELDDLLDE